MYFRIQLGIFLKELSICCVATLQIINVCEINYICGGKTGKHTRTDSIPEASSRPFIILKYKESPVVHSTYIDIQILSVRPHHTD